MGDNIEKRLRNPGLDVSGTMSPKGKGHLFTSPSDTLSSAHLCPCGPILAASSQRRRFLLGLCAPLSPSNLFVLCEGPRGSLTALLYLKTFPQARSQLSTACGPSFPASSPLFQPQGMGTYFSPCLSGCQAFIQLFLSAWTAP